MSTPRFNFGKAATEASRLMFGFEKYIAQSGLDKNLLELIKTRASQINNCGYCLEVHTKNAMARGEDPQRYLCLTAWEEMPYYTEAERAALALTEAITLIADIGMPDEVYDEAAKHFSEKELIDLIITINQINCWNRINVIARPTVGEHKARA